MTIFLVTYPIIEGATFDADYYVAHHLPLVRDSWARYGLTEAKALISDETAPAYAAVAILEFANKFALDTALASPEAGAVFGDVAKFTDIAPITLRCEVG